MHGLIWIREVSLKNMEIPILVQVYASMPQIKANKRKC